MTQQNAPDSCPIKCDVEEQSADDRSSVVWAKEKCNEQIDLVHSDIDDVKSGLMHPGQSIMMHPGQQMVYHQPVYYAQPHYAVFNQSQHVNSYNSYLDRHSSGHSSCNSYGNGGNGHRS